MLSLCLCLLLTVDYMPPIFDPHLPLSDELYEDSKDTVPNQIDKEILDILYPESAPHDLGETLC